MFNVGDKVVCIDNKGVSNSLTIGKKYEVEALNESTNILRVRDDLGRLFGYLFRRFEIKVKEEVW